MYGCFSGVGDVSDNVLLIGIIVVLHLDLRVGHRTDQQLVIDHIF